MKKVIMMSMVSLFLIYLSSCIQVVTMSDIELVLIDEDFSIIEYQESQINQINLILSNQKDCDCQAVRIIEGRMNQMTQVYVFEFNQRSHAVDFVQLIMDGEGIDITNFEYAKRYGNIVILSINQEVHSLFEDI